MSFGFPCLDCCAPDPGLWATATLEWQSVGARVYGFGQLQYQHPERLFKHRRIDYVENLTVSGDDLELTVGTSNCHTVVTFDSAVALNAYSDEEMDPQTGEVTKTCGGTWTHTRTRSPNNGLSDLNDTITFHDNVCPGGSFAPTGVVETERTETRLVLTKPEVNTGPTPIQTVPGTCWSVAGWYGPALTFGGVERHEDGSIVTQLSDPLEVGEFEFGAWPTNWQTVQSPVAYYGVSDASKARYRFRVRLSQPWPKDGPRVRLTWSEVESNRSEGIEGYDSPPVRTIQTVTVTPAEGDTEVLTGVQSLDPPTTYNRKLTLGGAPARAEVAWAEVEDTQLVEDGLRLSDLVGGGRVAASFTSNDQSIRVRRSFRFQVSVQVPWNVGTIPEAATVSVQIPEFRGGWSADSVQQSIRTVSVTLPAHERVGVSDWQSVNAPGNGWVLLGEPTTETNLPHWGFVRVEVLDAG